MSKEKEKLSLYRQTINWVKDIPHKLEILLNNLYTMAASLACIGVGIYTVFEVIPRLTGYVATAGLIAASIVAVDGAFKLIHFLVRGDK